jgi:hypothetical protein
MENVLHNLDINSNYSIIGEKDQALQIVLKKNDSIVCKKQNLYYFSSDSIESIEYHRLNSITPITERPGVLLKDNSLIRLKNTKNNFDYVGLLNNGKLMKVIPMLYKDLFIRYDSLVAFSDGVELYNVKEVTSKVKRFQFFDYIYNADNKFVLVHTKKNSEIDKFTFTDYQILKDYLFVSSESNTF